MACEHDMNSDNINGVEIELIDRGAGPPILFLHPEIGLKADLDVLTLMSQHARLIAPSHPGFGKSSLPRSFSTVDDLAYFYLDLLDHFDLNNCLVVGVSFGAWIAAEIAIKCCDRISGLVLAAPVGIKVGSPEDASIVDYYTTKREKYLEMAYSDPSHGRFVPEELTEEEALIVARNQDAAAIFSWMPYMYDPKLAQRLYRIKCPTMVIRGQDDHVLMNGYEKKFADLIPGARVANIKMAGHFPHIEAPQDFTEMISGFQKELL
jgi:pimeloyl-ACP methyl ester carboxylesterase